MIIHVPLWTSFLLFTKTSKKNFFVSSLPWEKKITFTIPFVIELNTRNTTLSSFDWISRFRKYHFERIN